VTTQPSDPTTQNLITGFQVLSIYVSDLARAVDFYTNVLGMETDEQYPPHEAKKGIILKAGGLMIYLEGGRSATNDPGMTANTISPTFTTDSIRAAYEAIKAKNAPFVEDYYEESPDFAMFRVADPDGNIIEFAGKP
jgi:catechol 2,3-dioxygenase-like lactoylglutathione lyase family enzyme